jgi:probable H4MPT-linked C1 transfer pathway protein
MWQRVSELSAQLGDMLGAFVPFDVLAVTMTAELADCFTSKADGVGRILDAVQAAAAQDVSVWQTSGEFVPPDIAREFPLLTAAANWHALATWTGRVAPQGTALLIDMGSTTTDIIPLDGGLPSAAGLTDRDRVLRGELIYTGVRRTPVCAVTDALPLDGAHCPVAAEVFATMHDVYLVLGDVPEDVKRIDTADGRPATRKAARRRLARMLCCDLTELSNAQLFTAAKFLRAAQQSRLAGAVARVVGTQSSPPLTIVLCGEGEFVARRLIAASDELSSADVISLTDLLGPAHSQAACAYALARLARERTD